MVCSSSRIYKLLFNFQYTLINTLWSGGEVHFKVMLLFPAFIKLFSDLHYEGYIVVHNQ